MCAVCDKLLESWHFVAKMFWRVCSMYSRRINNSLKTQQYGKHIICRVAWELIMKVGRIPCKERQANSISNLKCDRKKNKTPVSGLRGKQSIKISQLMIFQGTLLRINPFRWLSSSVADYIAQSVRCVMKGAITRVFIVMNTYMFEVCINYTSKAPFLWEPLRTEFFLKSVGTKRQKQGYVCRVANIFPIGYSPCDYWYDLNHFADLKAIGDVRIPFVVYIFKVFEWYVYLHIASITYIARLYLTRHTLLLTRLPLTQVDKYIGDTFGSCQSTQIPSFTE